MIFRQTRCIGYERATRRIERIAPENFTKAMFGDMVAQYLAQVPDEALVISVRCRCHDQISLDELVARALRRGAVVLHGQQFGSKIRGRHGGECAE